MSTYKQRKRFLKKKRLLKKKRFFKEKKKAKKEKVPKWIDCAELPLPSTFTSKIIKLNSNHLLAITSNGALYIYNIIDDQWKTPYGDWKLLQCRIKSIAVDYTNHQIYLFASKRSIGSGMIFSFEYNELIKTNILPKIKVKTIKFKDHFHSKRIIASIFANNQLHLLGAYYKTIFHYIFDIKSSQFTKISEFDEIKGFKTTLILLKSTLMLFGAPENTYMYSFDTRKWSKQYNERKHLKPLLQAGYQDCCLAPNGTNLILFGGFANYNRIELIRINDGKLSVLHFLHSLNIIEGPLKVPCKAMLMEHGAIDDILVIGYYRKCLVDGNLRILPNDIVKLICAIGQRDTFIHYFPIYKRMNYKINLELLMEERWN